MTTATPSCAGGTKRGVQLAFHSFHAAHASPGQIAAIGSATGTQYERPNPAATYTYPATSMPAFMTTTAGPVGYGATSRECRCQPWTPDRTLYDSTAARQERAMTATLCGGTLTATRARTTAAEPDLHSHPDSLPPATGRRPEHPVWRGASRRSGWSGRRT
jgi:hypothetical protein